MSYDGSVQLTSFLARQHCHDSALGACTSFDDKRLSEFFFCQLPRYLHGAIGALRKSACPSNCRVATYAALALGRSVKAVGTLTAI